MSIFNFKVCSVAVILVLVMLFRNKTGNVLHAIQN